MHRAIGAYDWQGGDDDDDEWDTDPDFVNTSNQENAKGAATKQLGGMRTAAEAAQVVKKNQVDMDRQRGIASVHGQRAKADQALMQQKQREAEEFSKRQQQLHQRTEQAQSAARQRDQASQAE
mmetsp:Transcript_22933/g.39017  ORF Transcript_22933/g.39017 Transcript_22933/m.39017 type:complete len:123 (-) Transcript_22933:11-379(-)